MLFLQYLLIFLQVKNKPHDGVATCAFILEQAWSGIVISTCSRHESSGPAGLPRSQGEAEEEKL
jgi:hypothetical protein